MNRAAAAALMAGLLAGCGPPPLRVYFVGNSYTSANDIPAMVASLAAADGRRLAATTEVPGGFTLQRHWAEGRAAKAIAEGHYDWVVLQDQSQVPSFEPSQVASDMAPAVRAFVAAIRAAGARPLLYETWARQHGDPDNRPHDSYAAMQARLCETYEAFGRDLGVPVAPVGRAWRVALDRHPGLVLWGPDGSHPTPAGSYLAACVLYQRLFDHAPTADLGIERADELQQAAGEALASF